MALKWTKEKLIDQIQYVYETDVGDFKRKAGLYLNRFAESQTDPDLKREIQNLKDRVLFKELEGENEMERLDFLRSFLLEELKKL